MKQSIAMMLCLTLFLIGCQTQQSGLIRRPSWWERRMDRLETWNMRHGYPLNRTRDAVVYTAVVTAIVAGTIWYAFDTTRNGLRDTQAEWIVER